MTHCLTAVGLALLVGTPAPKEAPKKADVPSIVGEWECSSFMGGGRAATPNELSQIAIVMEFTADGKFRSQEGKARHTGKYTINASKDPAELDYAAGGIAKGNHGIYKVDKDTLTICVAEGGGVRPTKFESPAGTRIMLLTFTRVEKKKE